MEFEFTDLVRSAALVLAFVLLVVCDRRTWLTADIMATVAFGVGFLCIPRTLMGFMVTADLDDVHAQLLQILGVTLICSSIMPYLTRDTRDGTVPITLMMARVFHCSILLLAQGATYWGTTRGKKTINYNTQHVYFGMLGAGLWMLGNLIHLLRSHDFSSYPQHNIRINSHLRVDAWINMVSAICMIAFPELMLSFYTKGIDAVHVYLTRVIGTFDLGAAVIALQAPGFLHEHDKKHHLVARLLTVLAVILVAVFQLFYFQTLDNQQLLTQTLFCVPYMLNALFGFFAGGTASYRLKYD